MESSILSHIELAPDETKTMLEYINSHPDHTAYHLLFALRKGAPDAYSDVPKTSKARVLCDAMRHQIYLNDWGYLDPGNSFDGPAAQALLEAGDDALRPLLSLLDDARSARLFGSEEATLSNMYEYRVKDFAYRYFMLLLGRQPTFEADPRSRDIEIERLKSTQTK
jgi:hypothetical protein